MAKGPTDVERLRRAKLITKEKDGEPTLQDIALADEQLTAENIDRQLSIIYNVDPERAIALGYEADDDSPEGAVSFDEAKKILSDDPSDANEWQKESGDTTDPGVLDVAFGVPARAVASAVTRNIVEPAFEALDLASTRKKVGKAFRQAGGDLQNVTTDELVLISRNPKGFESRINKINAEIVKRMSGE
jgi:hypothetical protein